MTRETLTTKITEPTMARLKAASEAAGESISKTGARAIAYAMHGENPMQAALAISMDAFSDRMKLLLMAHPGRGAPEEALAAWECKAAAITERLERDLRDDIDMIASGGRN